MVHWLRGSSWTWAIRDRSSLSQVIYFTFHLCISLFACQIRPILYGPWIPAPQGAPVISEPPKQRYHQPAIRLKSQPNYTYPINLYLWPLLTLVSQIGQLWTLSWIKTTTGLTIPTKLWQEKIWNNWIYATTQFSMTNILWFILPYLS